MNKHVKANLDERIRNYGRDSSTRKVIDSIQTKVSLLILLDFKSNETYYLKSYDYIN